MPTSSCDDRHCDVVLLAKRRLAQKLFEAFERADPSEDESWDDLCAGSRLIYEDVIGQMLLEELDLIICLNKTESDFVNRSAKPGKD